MKNLFLFLIILFWSCNFRFDAAEYRFVTLTLLKIEKYDNSVYSVVWEDENKTEYPEYATLEDINLQHYQIGMKVRALLKR
jgi:hypothetical protein